MAIPGAVGLGIFQLEFAVAGVTHIRTAFAHDPSGAALPGKLGSVILAIRPGIALLVIRKLLLVCLRILGVEVCGAAFLGGH